MRHALLLPLILATLVMAALLPATAQQTPFRPVAVVNDIPITAYDLDQRMRILQAFGLPFESAEALRDLAIDQLVDDRLKLQAGKAAALTPSDGTRAEGVAEFARRLQLSPEALLDRLKKANVSDQAITDMAHAEIIWIAVVRNRFLGRVEPGEAEIDAEIALAGTQGQGSFRVQELGLPFTAGGRTEAQTRTLADRLVTELNNGRDFAATVRRFSEAPSASNDGNVGWVSTSGLPSSIVETLASLSPGQVSQPIAVSGGLTILKLLEKRQISGGADPTDPQLRQEVRTRMIAEQTNRLAEGLLQEIRRDALIELR